ncbi:MAG TPA: serine/threonine-protein kinase, partial [Urbifossiella sp.]|nr:serine/threonine-protein kinase [Urbifossiella sp.]
MTPAAPDPSPTATTGPHGGLESTVARFAEDMVRRWRLGERPTAESYFDRRPDLWDRPDAALELVAEELALRDEFGPPASRSELARRFPQWAARAQAVLDYQRVLGPHPGPPRPPGPGELLGPFQVHTELGRGAHGRVYRAAQLDLADRPVVLKVGPDDGGEHLSLARLQHTHIVPLYSAHEFPDRGLRALCMPFFGGATLADLLARVDQLPPGPRAGRDLLAALAATDPDGDPPTRGPAWGILDQAGFAGAVCWIGACLADALQYAHERGLLHLDVKPSNVLLAADGVPMLLDFHLALPPLRAGAPPPPWLGGTPGYMPPEQEAAFRAVQEGTSLPADLDPRADVFALGRLLADALDRDPAAVTAGLSDVVAKTTAPAAADRYPTAAALAADLRRHLSDLPLRGVRNRSVRERWRKWRRRRPYAPAFAL